MCPRLSIALIALVLPGCSALFTEEAGMSAGLDAGDGGANGSTDAALGGRDGSSDGSVFSCPAPWTLIEGHCYVLKSNAEGALEAAAANAACDAQAAASLITRSGHLLILSSRQELGLLEETFGTTEQALTGAFGIDQANTWTTVTGANSVSCANSSSCIALSTKLPGTISCISLTLAKPNSRTDFVECDELSSYWCEVDGDATAGVPPSG